MFRFIITTCMLFLLPSLARAQEPAEHSIMVAGEGGLLGFVSYTGEWVIEPRYNYVMSNHEPGPLLTYMVWENAGGAELTGLVSNRGQVLVPALYQDLGWPSSDGLIAVQSNHCWGFLTIGSGWLKDPLMPYLSIPYRYEETAGFNAQGLANVSVLGRWGIIDQGGSEVLPTAYSHVGVLTDRGSTWVQVYEEERAHFFNIERSQPPLLASGTFDEFGPFSEGLAAYRVGDVFGYLDETGSTAFLVDADELGEPFQDGLARVSQAGAWGVINSDGDWLISPMFEGLRHYSDSLLAAKVDNLWGLIDLSGNWVLPNIFESIRGRHFRIDGKWGLLDGSGQIIADPTFDWIGPFISGYEEARATKEGVAGFLNRSGVWEEARTSVSDLEERGAFTISGWAAAKSQGRWGLIDREGNWLLEPRYDCLGASCERPPPIRIYPAGLPINSPCVSGQAAQ